MNEGELSEKLDGLYVRIAAYKFNAREIPLTLSLGCAYYPADHLHGWLLSDMLRAANAKLYEAKEGGRNQYLLEKFDPNKEYRPHQ
ncbi:MAG: hypothetical protein PHE47_09450 [Oscillospiraceae bacterium]|nr:hypothetical protein [Oscillospiraceae bacterium]